MVKIRLKRIGKKKAPFYRVVVTDARAAAACSKSIEEIGIYDPLKEPTVFKVDEEAVKRWLKNGAQPTETVSKLLKKAGILD